MLLKYVSIQKQVKGFIITEIGSQSNAKQLLMYYDCAHVQSFVIRAALGQKKVFKHAVMLYTI